MLGEINMANAVLLSPVNGLKSPKTALPNGGITFENIASCLGKLSDLTGSIPDPIKELHQALKALYLAANSSDFKSFQNAVQDVENKIVTITKSPSKEIFKNYSMFANWCDYLKPLTDLQKELEHFRTQGSDGYSTSRLEDPIKATVDFMNGEIKAHTGVIQKALSMVAQEAKKVVWDKFGSVLGSQEPSLNLQSKLTPLETLVHDLIKFRTDSERYYPKYVQKKLLEALETLESYDPKFKGVFQYVIDKIGPEKDSLLKSLDTHVGSFIREKIIPTIQGDDFHQAYYQTSLQFKDVSQESTTDDRAKQIQWGKDRIAKGTKEAKEVRSLLTAVNFILEMNYFGDLSKFKVEPYDNPISLWRKVKGLIGLIENHPMITHHTKFNEAIEALINGFMDQTYQKLGTGSVGSIQEVKGLLHGKNFAGALFRLEYLLANPTQGKRKASVITQGVAALKEQARAYGVPDSLLEPIDTVADLVDSKLSNVLHGAEEGKQLAPFAKLSADLDLLHANRESRHPGTIERALMGDLKGIEAAYPELKGLVRFVKESKGKTPVIDRIDQLIATFITAQIKRQDTPLKEVLRSHANQFYLSLYHAADKQVSQTRLYPAEQIEEGKRIFHKNQYSPVALMQAIDKMFEASALKKVAEKLKVFESDTTDDLSRKVDLALGALAAHPESEELKGALKLVYSHVQDYVDRILRFSRGDEDRIDQAHTMAQKGDYVGALKALNAIFDQGSLLASVGTAEEVDFHISAAEQLAVDFEKGQVSKEGVITPEQQKKLIALEERKFAHNLSLFTTFKVIAKRKGWDARTTDEKFEAVIKIVDEIDYDGSVEQLAQKRERETVFKEQLKTLTQEGTIDRFANWIVFKLVKHFTSQFSKSMVQGAENALVNPLKRPTKKHHGVMRAVNNGILGLLFAERIWREDSNGKRGVGEKDDHLIEILQDMNHKEKKGNELVKEVIDKALHEFNIGKFSKNSILNGIATLFVKSAIKLIVNRIHLTESVLESISDSIYSERYPNYSLDVLLLNQIKELEKVLGEEGAEVVIREGDNGKRLAQQLVDNLFQLLKERKVLTPGDFEQMKGGFLERLKDGTDTIVKGVLRDLMLFGIEQVQTPQRMNQTVLETLKHANRALRPSEATLLRELFSDKGEDIPTADLVLLFKANYRKEPDSKEKGEITRQECEAALAKKYEAIEKELHESMDRIIHKGIGGVVESQVETLLKTPRQVLLEGVQWMHEQFTPYKAHLAGKTAYLEELESLLSRQAACTDRRRQSHLEAKIKTRHQKLLIQLQNQMKTLKRLKTYEPSAINRQIHCFYQAINALHKPMNTLNEALMKKNIRGAQRALQDIRKEMATVQGILDGVEANLSYQELSFAEKAKEEALSGVKKGAEVVKPAIHKFLNHHIQGHASEVVSMYKTRSTFTSMMQQGLFRSYLEYQSSLEDVDDPGETIAEDLYAAVTPGKSTDHPEKKRFPLKDHIYLATSNPCSLL